MKISEAKKGLRVQLSAKARALHTLEPETAAQLGRSMLIPREFGTLISGRILKNKPGHEEGLFVRVIWDGLRTPESWHLVDLEKAP